MHLALTNIVTNACKYSHNKPVLIYIAASDNYVVIIIKDEGVGIPDEEINFVFDPFFRASNTHSFEGYGMGLPLAKNIIHLHNGLLSVRSTIHVGTSVKVKLPIAVL